MQRRMFLKLVPALASLPVLLGLAEEVAARAVAEVSPFQRQDDVDNVVKRLIFAYNLVTKHPNFNLIPDNMLKQQMILYTVSDAMQGMQNDRDIVASHVLCDASNNPPSHLNDMICDVYWTKVEGATSLNHLTLSLEDK